MGLGILASEAANHLDLVGKLRGYFIVVFAVGLFCGSVYLLLSTNLGSRLAFLLSFSALTGFLMILGLIWSINLTPITALHGPLPRWVVKEIVADPTQAKTAAIRGIASTGVPLDAGAAGEVKATVDSVLTAEGGEFQQFASATDYVVVKGLRQGGGSLSFFRHRPLFAVLGVQSAKKVEPLPGAAPPPPKPDPSKPVKFVILEKDLGSLRRPPFIMSMAFGILFFLSLFVMHTTERAEQKAKAAALEPVPAPA